MKCPNCNAEIEDDSVFCTMCGTRVKAENTSVPEAAPTQEQSVPEAAPTQEQSVPETAPTQEQPVPEAAQTSEQSASETVPIQGQPAQQGVYGQNTGAQNNAGGQPPYGWNGQVQPSFGASAPKKTLNSKQKTGLIAIIAAAVCVLLLVVILVKTHKNTINLQDYTEVEFSGYDTCGTAQVVFDYESFYEDVQKSMNKKGRQALSYDSYDLSGIVNGLQDATDVLSVYEDVSYTLSESDELSNGDEVTVSFTFDNDVAKKYGIVYKGEDETFEVEGLEAVEEIDPFDYIEVTFSGTSPDAYASVDQVAENDAVSSIYFSADPDGAIAKGDTVTITAEADEDYLLSQYGCKLTTTSKEYTCEDVDAYIEDGSEIGDELLGQMKTQTEDVVNAYFADETTYISLADLKYVGYYFLSAKSSSAWDHNYVYIVYSGTVSSLEENGFAATTVYFPVRFENLIKYQDGTDYVDLDSTRIYGDTSLSYSWSTVDGYDSLTTMKNELVTSEKGEFNVASFGGLE